MKRTLLAGLLAGSLFLAGVQATPAHAQEYYKLTVTRSESNVYKIVEVPGVVIKTRMCLELALMEEAVLVWDSLGALNNQLLFGLDYGYPTSCTVEGIYREVTSFGF